ncbi:transglycosylase SLT domain-containing protein [Blastococcus sp. LR1]|uniref:aggregation-promoting factor C-terminal-like domain-containing protein n=1 Tax=Blastococcus sp. LR1 TaxID=2877000 RepID=UPI001CC8F5BD|nr:transglycosylase SLT domain-containing protein [Blastococcus sp. LR1]MCA0145169.1 transglycosylase SLT domain-containing protein [Blastococcus sp. LR1]
MNLRLTRAARPSTGTRSAALRARRPALLLGVAAAGALMVNVVTAGEPAAQAEPQLASVSVAEQLGITQEAAPVEEHAVTAVDSLGELAASRSERQAAQDAAVQAQIAADQAELDRRAAEEAARKAAEEEAARKAAEAAAAEAARKAEAAAASARPGRGTTTAAAPAGSYKQYAMSKVGSSGEFSCLESLWGKESGWNPNAQNPSSTAYGIPQFLDSTWKGTGIAKTSDGYRQIDAGLIYIENRFGSPCAAWSHSQSKGWY